MAVALAVAVWLWLLLCGCGCVAVGLCGCCAVWDVPWLTPPPVWCGVVAPNRYPQLMHAAAVAALGAPDFPGASSWTDGAKSTFVNLLVAAPGVEAGKRAPGVTPIVAANAEAWFVEVVKDFAMISRGRAPCDTLYRHTRPSAS